MDVRDAGKFCGVCASLKCCGCSDRRAGFAMCVFWDEAGVQPLVPDGIRNPGEARNKEPDWCRGKEETVFGGVGMVQSFLHPSSAQDVPLCPIHSTSGQAKCGRSWMFFPLNSMLIDHMQCLQTLNTQALCCSISA